MAFSSSRIEAAEITGSLFGTASHIKVTGSGIVINWDYDLLQLTASITDVVYADSASLAQTASYFFTASVTNATYADTASYFFTASVTSASLAQQAVSASYALSASYSDLSSLALTASYFFTSSVTSASLAQTASYFFTSSVTSASLAQTASYFFTSSVTSASLAQRSISASYALSSSYAESASLSQTASYFFTASVTSASLAERAISSSYALSSSVSDYAQTASYVANQTIILPDRRQSSWMNGMAYIQGNKILGRGSLASSAGTSLYATADSWQHLVEIAVKNRPAAFTKLVVDPSTIYAIGSNGLAYTAIGNANGQLGRGPVQSGNDGTRQRSIMAPITASVMSGSGIEVVDVFHPSDTAQIYNSSFNSVIWKVNNSGQYKYYGAGHNDFGQLALGVTGDRDIPSESVSLRGLNIVSMSMGDAMSGSVFALQTNGEVLCWGANGQGQLGIGNTTNQLTPLTPKSGSGLASITGSVKDVASVQCGSATVLNPRYHNVFILLNNGTVLCSGYGTSYSRGDGQTSNLNYFTEVKTSATTRLSNIVKLFCRGFVRTALDSSGNLWSWGFNQDGYMGDGSAGDVAYQYAKIIATGVEDVYVYTDTTNALLLIKQNGEWYGSGEVGVNALPLGYDKDSTDINPREKLESIDHSRVKDFFAVGGFDGTNFTGLITQYEDDSLYYNGASEYILSSTGLVMYVPTKLPL